MSPTNSLTGNRSNIAQEKDLGKPIQPNDRELIGFEEPNKPAKNHIYGGSVERRAEQQEQSLDKVWPLCPFP